MRKDNITTKAGTKTIIEFPSQESRIQIGDQTALETLGDAIIYVYLLEKQIIRGISQLVLETRSTFLQWSRFKPKVTFNPKEP